jgi:hypothetical protein
MGSRKKAKKKAPATTKLLRTPFMAAFHKKLIFDRSKPKEQRILWPPKVISDAQALQDFSDTMAVLGARMAREKPVAKGDGSFRDRVIKFLGRRKWPEKSPVPAQYATKERMVHLIEMAVISDRMLQAFSEGRGGGGGGSSWPPHV